MPDRQFGDSRLDPFVIPISAQGSAEKPAPLPTPTGSPPYRMDLAEVLSAERIQAIHDAGRIYMHIAGDTGGIFYPVPQTAIARQLEQQLLTSIDNKTAFLYIVGDITYYTGHSGNYYSQFYKPYQYYNNPIFAIPGNHDGESSYFIQNVLNPEPSLKAFMEYFCSKTPHVPAVAGTIKRDTMTQPNCYFTLNTPFATVIGLYSNTPDNGYIDDVQQEWFANELIAAPTTKAIIVAVHHSPYSLDTSHGHSQYIQNVIDAAITKSGRYPSIVVSGHSHNYQRFTRFKDSRNIPYLVTGNGGYFDLYNLAKVNNKKIATPYNIPQTDLTLENYCENRYGFLRVSATETLITGESWIIPNIQEPTSKLQDLFTLHWPSGTLA